ncbi:hypothetical protein ARMSODRAFT_599658 [Armillaria solidipes]|uniref:Uncharacterized protein n=1 Tax=Armillaria solidipes TaxID=1076256 RepID=A0A2H3AVD6_9AGAR|nr:hypothetical protein ARMSODRAFT_599658 [Armillaria solidipes]
MPRKPSVFQQSSLIASLCKKLDLLAYPTTRRPFVMAASQRASLTVSRLHDPSEHMAGGYVYGITGRRDRYFQV